MSTLPIDALLADAGPAFTTAAHAWWSWVRAQAPQVALLVSLALAIDLATRRRLWPHLRAALWGLPFVRLVLPPGLSASWAWRSGGPWLNPGGADLDGGPSLAVDGLGADDASLAAAGPLLALAAAGTALLVALRAARHRRARAALRDARRAVPVRLHPLLDEVAARVGLRRAPEVLCSAAADSPLVTGVLRPLLVLPADFARDARTEDLEHALLHECVHLRRRDPARAALRTALVLAHWWHPLLWLATRRLASLTELCCDARAAALAAHGPAPYRRSLLRCAGPRALRRDRVAQSGTALPDPVGLLGGGADLLARLDALERPAARHPVLRRAAALVVASTLGAALLPVAAADLPRDAAPAAVARAPSPDDPGCLELRYRVLAALARREAPGAPHDPAPRAGALAHR